MIPCMLLKKDLQTIWPDCSSYYLNVSQKAKAKNELLIAIIWIARCGSTCLLEGFVHSFTLAWTAALKDASLFFFYFYPLAVNNNWLYAGCWVSSKPRKQSNIVEGLACSKLRWRSSSLPVIWPLTSLVSLQSIWGFPPFLHRRGDNTLSWNDSLNDNCWV